VIQLKDAFSVSKIKKTLHCTAANFKLMIYTKTHMMKQFKCLIQLKSSHTFHPPSPANNTEA